MEKIVYQLDERGYLMGEAIADESPMEPGVFLIPRLCVEVTPPPFIEGKYRVFAGGMWSYADSLPVVEPDDPAYDPIQVKLEQINAECDKRIKNAIASYPDTEVLTFPKQENEARAYLADPMAVTPLINALAVNRGIDKAELANRIIAKADYFAEYTGKVVGHRQKLEDMVHAGAEVDPFSGWPE